MQLPYIEYRVIQIGEKNPQAKKNLLKFLKERKQSTIKEADFQWKGSEEDPVLRLNFHSYEAFHKAFYRLVPLFERIFKIIHFNNNVMFFKKNTPERKEGCYLILELKSNYISEIIEHYRFIIPAANYLNWAIQMEELEGKILLFYQTREDFLDTQVDHLDFTTLREWLIKKNLWKEEAGPTIKRIVDDAKDDVENYFSDSLRNDSLSSIDFQGSLFY